MADRTRSRAGAVARDPPASQRGIRARREGGKARRLFRAPYLDDVLDGRDELVSRQVPWVVLGADAARKRPEEHQRGSPLRVRRREYRRHRAAFPECEQRGALAANRVDHRTHVVHPCLDPPERRGSVRQPSAALVEPDQSRERPEPFEEARVTRLLPVELEVRDEAGYEHQIKGPVARDLVGDVDFAAAGVAYFGLLHSRSFVDSVSSRHQFENEPGGTFPQPGLPAGAALERRCAVFRQLVGE